ncbi:hypothetical protein CEXT_18071 [Caerostris extrusa]|uniref:Uncharacterized protein n=1 Tax=Caerostris extrusa TaxID=172846 RepID=A0AAV4QG92_CAEEX|nr:hypothetical protein CEXT_18071 [Caerostris extrusa]
MLEDGDSRWVDILCTPSKKTNGNFSSLYPLPLKKSINSKNPGRGHKSFRACLNTFLSLAPKGKSFEPEKFDQILTEDPWWPRYCPPF